MGRRSGGVVTAVTESGRRRRILVTAVTTPDLQGFSVVAVFIFAEGALTCDLAAFFRTQGETEP